MRRKTKIERLHVSGGDRRISAAKPKCFPNKVASTFPPTDYIRHGILRDDPDYWSERWVGKFLRQSPCRLPVLFVLSWRIHSLKHVSGLLRRSPPNIGQNAARLFNPTARFV